MQATNNIPLTANLIMAVIFILVQLFSYFLAPVLIHVNILWAWSLVLPVLLTTTYWSLTHESLHGVFHPDTQWNDRVGRLLCILFGAPWSILRFGHLMHHRFNRTPLDRSELVTPPVGNFTRLKYYFRLLQGLYLGELASNLLILLPKTLLLFLFERAVPPCTEKTKLRNVFRRQILAGRRLRQTRVDAILTLAVLTASFSLYGEFWYCLLLLLIGRGLFISFFDNAYHYGTGLSDRKHAYNLALPTSLSKLILHFNLHRVHHHYPSVPWSALPTLTTQTADRMDGDYWRVSMRQFAGTITLDKP